MNEKSRKELSNALKEIIVWPGSRKDFENFIGYKTSWVDLGRNIKGVVYHDEDYNPFYFSKVEVQKRIFNEGVVAIVNSSPIKDDVYFGIPVKKKEKFWSRFINHHHY